MLLSASVLLPCRAACDAHARHATLHPGRSSCCAVIYSSRHCFRRVEPWHAGCTLMRVEPVCSSATADPQAGSVSDQDRQHMQHALKLARTGLGNTHPNPAVGCVIVKNSKVIGEGYHPKAGEPHAEVFALRAAGQDAEGSTAYVTLEPCNHYGRTPPCSQALVDAKVAKVFVGVRDPNPLVNNAGVDTLQKAGIQVVQIGGQEEQSCYDINAEFMARMAPS